VVAVPGLDLFEFVAYTTQMNKWMRHELCHGSEADFFEVLAQRAIEVYLPPTPLPPCSAPADGRAPCHVVEAGLLRLEIPPDALPPSASHVSLRTLAPSAVDYLCDDATHELPYSPVVRVDLSHSYECAALPALGEPQTQRFAKPLTLVMPHSFAPECTAVVVLGAAHGALRWELCTDREFVLDGGEIRVPVPCTLPPSGVPRTATAQCCVCGVARLL
jgi:hypothetical protein